jgi:hypothetical protein
VVVRKQEEKEKIPKIVATFVYASSQGQRTHSARTKMFENCKQYENGWKPLETIWKPYGNNMETV